MMELAVWSRGRFNRDAKLDPLRQRGSRAMQPDRRSFGRGGNPTGGRFGWGTRTS